MSGLIDAVILHMTQHINAEKSARAAVLAVADWLDGSVGYGVSAAELLRILRAEAVPPPPPTAEDVIRKALDEWRGEEYGDGRSWEYVAAALRDAGLLREDTP